MTTQHDQKQSEEKEPVPEARAEAVKAAIDTASIAD
jgi:hypothetical protein